MLSLYGIRIIFFLGLIVTGARKIGCGIKETGSGMFRMIKGRDVDQKILLLSLYPLD